MTTLYLIRHGSYENPKDILHLRLPGFPLSETGKTEAERIGRHLSRKPVHAVFSSPLTRAFETAEAVASYHGITVTRDDRLLDIRSPLQGKPIAFLESIGWNFYSDEFIRAGGETLQDITARMKDFLRDILKKHKNKHVVAVSHCDPILCLLAYLEGRELTLESVRKTQYVPVAGGYAFEFTGDSFRGPDVRIHHLSV